MNAHGREPVAGARAAAAAVTIGAVAAAVLAVVVVAVLGGGTGCLGGGWGDESGGDDWDWDVSTPPREDVGTLYDVWAPLIWPVRNVFEGQTGVNRYEAFFVRGVHWDRYDSDDPLPFVRLVRAEDSREHPFRAVRRGSRAAGTVAIEPDIPLDPETRYLLVFDEDAGDHLMPHILPPPRSVAFTTASAPRVLGVWRTGETLVVVFSEPMRESSLYLGHGSVDMVFEDQGEPRSVVRDLNVADFDVVVRGHLLLVAPVTTKPFHLVLGAAVLGVSGAALDSDGDGRPDEGAPFTHLVYPTLLATCYTRADYPEPCIDAQRATEQTVAFRAPFVPELDL